MAKPIRATPTLNPQESKRFVENMLGVERRRPNSIEKYIIKALRK
jgi:hypothetical protein